MSDAVLEKRKKYTPPVEALKPQGKDRFMAKVHKNEEQVTASGLIVAEIAQDYPTTGDVVALSPNFNNADFPDVKEGNCVKVTMNGWNRFTLDGEVYAIGSAANVIAAYDPNDFCQE